MNAERTGVVPPGIPPSKAQKSALCALFSIGYAICIQVLVFFASSVIAFVLLGRFTDEATMAAFALGNTLCNLCGRFFLLGVACGLDTLASQAWGANEPKKVGLYGQRALLILLLCVCAPLTVVWWFASPILVAFGQPAPVADQTSQFARLSLPGLYAQAFSVAASKVFLALGKSKPVMLVSFFAQVVDIGLLVILIVHPCHLGLAGAAIAGAASNVVQPFCYLAFALRDPALRSCWPGITRDCLRGWGSYLRLGAPACFMLLAEALSWDLVSFLAGLCNTATGAHPAAPKAVLAAQGLLQSTISLCYCVPMAISRAGSTVIGNAVGAGDVARAAHTARLCLWLGLGSAAVLVATLVLLRDQVVQLYGAPKEVGGLVDTMLPYVAAFLFADCMQMSLTGVIVGAGKQTVTGPVLVVAYWIIGLPLGALAAFHPPWGGPRLGLLGLWLGMTVAVYIHSLSYLGLSFCGGLRCCGGLGVRWDRAVAEAKERLDDEDVSGRRDGATTHPAELEARQAPSD